MKRWKRAAGFVLGFLGGFLALSVIHELGHLVMGWATGVPIWGATVLHLRVIPFTLELVPGPTLYSITFGAPPNQLAEGLRAAAGCGSTLLVALVALSLRRRSRPAHEFLDGLSLVFALGGLDLVTYAWIPPLGIPRWILFGAHHSEPAVAAALLGIHPIMLHLGVGLVALGSIGTLAHKKDSPQVEAAASAR